MQRSGVALVVGLAVVVLLVAGLFGSTMMGSGMMGGYWGYGDGSWWGLSMLAFWLLVIVGGGVLLISLRPSSRQSAADSPDGGLYRSREILRERYARGEITREQYEQVRRDLEQD